jgi:hypothetical protein
VSVLALILAAGASALIGLASIPASASADGCVYTPAQYSYYTTDSAGNDPTVYESGGCDVFYMSRGALGPSYIWWRGWLKQSGGGWYQGGYSYDGTSGEGVALEQGVIYNTNEHAQDNDGGSWRNEEYH